MSGEIEIGEHGIAEEESPMLREYTEDSAPMWTSKTQVLRRRRCCGVAAVILVACVFLVGGSFNYWGDAPIKVRDVVLKSGETYKEEWNAIEDPSGNYGQVLVRQNAICQAKRWYVGSYSLGVCAMYVAAASAKFFVHNPRVGTFFPAPSCEVVFAMDRTCVEGFEDAPGWSFYDIVTMRDPLYCNAQYLNNTMSAAGKTLGWGTMHLGNARSCMPKPFVEYKHRHTSMFGRKICDVQEKLQCSPKQLDVIHDESCCSAWRWQHDCQPAKCAGTAAYSENSFSKKFFDPDMADATYEVCGNSPNFKPRLPSTIAIIPTQKYLKNPTCVKFKVARTISLRDPINRCPGFFRHAIRHTFSWTAFSYFAWRHAFPKKVRSNPLPVLLGKSSNASILVPGPFDAYTTVHFTLISHLSLRLWPGPWINPEKHILLPKHQQLLDRMTVYSWVGTPIYDSDRALTAEGDVGFAPRTASFFLFCFFDAMRHMQFFDGIMDGTNVWTDLLGGPGDPCPPPLKSCTKKEYIAGLFKGYTTNAPKGVAPDPIWPPEQINYRQLFMFDHSWIDACETYLIVGNYGATLIRAVTLGEKIIDPSQPSATPPAFVLATNSLSTLAVRQNFSKVGADMYFTSDFQPVAVKTPDGQIIWRSNAPKKLWQYWKFVWRSSVFLLITLVEHLYLAHLTAGLTMSAASREALPPEHPLRRLMTMFTFGTIEVNLMAVVQLLGPSNLLQRSTPFHDFNIVSETAQQSLPSLESRFGMFVDKSKFNAIPQPIRETAFFQDAPGLFDALYDMVSAWVDLYAEDWCDKGMVTDKAIEFFFKRYETWSMINRYKASDYKFLGLQNSTHGPLMCDGVKKFLAVMMFAVTGWHRTVGWVTDMSVDPDLQTFAWVNGEAYGRPRQHLLMALVSVSTTGKRYPKVDKDYSFLARGLQKEYQAAEIFKKFQTAMASLEIVIKGRNQKRPVPFNQMLPSEVDCSVGV